MLQGAMLQSDLGIIPWNTHLYYGSMTARKHFLVLWLTNTSSKSTCQWLYTSGLSSVGTMCKELSHCWCQVMCARHCTDSSTSWEDARSNLHIPVPQSSMYRRSNILTLWTQHSISPIKKSTSCNRCAARFCIMPLPSITLFPCPQRHFLRAIQIHNKHCKTGG